jgi:hypothetical protein
VCNYNSIGRKGTCKIQNGAQGAGDICAFGEADRLRPTLADEPSLMRPFAARGRLNSLSRIRCHARMSILRSWTQHCARR